MISARAALLEAAGAALSRVEEIGRVYDAPPLQAALPYELISIDAETDWSHKSAAGREIRLAACLFDKGERPLRLHRLAGEAEAALAGLPRDLGAWRLVTMQYLRTRIVLERDGRWAAVIEFRARLLAAD